MDTVISKISEIEAAATAIMDNASVRKREYTSDYETRTASFDAQLEEETNRKLDELRSRMEIDMNKQLTRQKQDADTILKQMEDNYRKNHETYAMELFRSMTEE